MKRTAAIFFLLILVFNFAGYRIVLASLKQSAAAAVEASVDKADYNEAELISVKTALRLPYYTPSAAFERAYGSVTINGKDYEYVKRRVRNDTLELLCLPNRGKTKLKEVECDLTKSSAAGQPLQKKGSTIKLSLPDFFQRIQTNIALESVPAPQTHSSANTGVPADGYAAGTDRPPASMRFSS